VVALPAGGAFRENPALGSGSSWTARLGFRGTWGGEPGQTLGLAVGLEAGSYDRGYLRATVDAAGSVPLASGSLRISMRGGAISDTPPAWRTFVLGGRGTLPGEPYRAYGGRYLALGRMEWRIPLRIPALRGGDFVDLGSGMTLAPFAAVGWSGEPLEGVPWFGTSGPRPVLGVASELLFNALRVDLGWSPRAGRFALLVDASPAWWPIL